MLDELHRVITVLPRLLATPEIWNSVHVVYEPPRVERLWCQHGDLRVFLHRIHPLEGGQGEALYHPHPWPSAVCVVSGRYEHKLGIDSMVLSTQVLTEGSEYELVNPYSWHSVRPLETSDSIMVTGKPYEPRVQMPVVPPPQPPLDPLRFKFLLNTWRGRMEPE